MTLIVIAGCGRVGEKVAKMVNDRGYEVTVVDEDEGVCEYLRKKSLIDRVENGSVTDKDLLETLEINRCEHFVSLTNDQEDNVRSCEIVKNLDDSTHTVARRTEKHSPIPSDNSDIEDIVYPEEHGARATVNLTTTRDFRTLEDIEGDLELIEVRVRPGSPVAGMELSEVMFPEGTRVISDNQNNDIATGDTVLEESETYLVASKTNMTDDIRKLFGAN